MALLPISQDVAGAKVRGGRRSNIVYNIIDLSTENTQYTPTQY
jgi:hypothetical protein